MSNRSAFSLMALVLIALVAFVPTRAFAFSVLRTNTDLAMRWNSPSITMELDASVLSVMDRDAALQAAVMASEAWRGLPGVPDIDVTDEMQLDPSEAGNRISVVRPWPYAPEYIAITRHEIDWNGRIKGADILLNGDVEFDLLQEGSSEPVFRHDLASVLTHEMGHVLGLDHSAVETATMYPTTGLGLTSARTLDDDDENGIIEVYSHSLLESKDAWECSAGTPLGGKHRTNPSAWLALPLALLLLALRRRARSLAVACALSILLIGTAHAARTRSSVEVGAWVVGQCQFDAPPLMQIEEDGVALDVSTSSLSVLPSCRGTRRGVSVDHPALIADPRPSGAPTTSIAPIAASPPNPVIVTVHF